MAQNKSLVKEPTGIGMRISVLRDKLHKAIDSMDRGEIIRLSRKLDKQIVKFMQERG